MWRQSLVLAGIVVCVIALVAVPECSPKTDAPSNTGTTGSVTPIDVAHAWPAQIVSALDYLPHEPAKDGHTDYTLELQTAIDASANRTLVLPDFPILVSRRPGQTYCLLVHHPITIVGVAGSVLRETHGAVQILRSDSTDDVHFEGFTVQGKGGQGSGLAHGILQVWRGTNVSADGVTSIDSDADGIVIANVQGARVTNCRAVRTSKSGIYLSQCKGGIVQGCIVEDGTGHFTPQGNRVGAGIQLSSNVDVVCNGNIVRGGIGIGILCDANDASLPPTGCVISSNQIEGVRNTVNMDISCGIRCQNLAQITDTETLVTGNAVRGSGVYGIYMENHGRSTVANNTIIDSDRSGLVIGTIRGLAVCGNTIRHSDQSHDGGAASIYLINNASNVVIGANTLIEDPLVSSAKQGVIDVSSGPGNALEPSARSGSGPPASGSSNRGDLVWNAAPVVGAYAGWICTSAGSPGVWAPFGRIE